MAILPFRFAFHTRSSVCSVAAHTQKPSSCKRWMLCTMLDTCATGTCVMAPAELLYVEASTRALRLLGMIRARCAHSLARAADGAQVARVGEVVAQDHERAAIVLFGVAVGGVDHLADAHVVERRGLGHDALMATASRLLVKLVARHLDDLHAVALGLAHDVLDHGIALHVIAHKDTAAWARRYGTPR